MTSKERDRLHCHYFMPIIFRLILRIILTNKDELYEGYAVSAEQETKNTEFKSAIKFLSRGSFYHKWHPSFDLTFRLTLSANEQERFNKAAKNEETQKIYGKKVTFNRIEKLKHNPINLPAIFEICPRPIPSDFWGN